MSSKIAKNGEHSLIAAIKSWETIDHLTFPWHPVAMIYHLV